MLDAERDQLLELGGAYRLAVGGAAPTRLDLGAVLPLTDSPVDAADMLTQLEHRRQTA